MYKKICFVFLTLVLTLGLFACTNEKAIDNSRVIDPNDPLTGTWHEKRDDGILSIYFFYGDGKGCQQVLDIFNDFSYIYDDTTITLSIYIDNPPIIRKFDYSIDGTNLFITDKNTGIISHYYKVDN